MSGSVRSCETAACSSEMVIARLEAAGRTLLSMSGGERSQRMRTFWPDVVRSPWEGYGYTEAGPVRLSPSPADITAMDEALRWIAAIPDSQHVLRRIVWARVLVHPVRGDNIFSFKQIGVMVGASGEAVRGWHRRGIDLICRALNDGKIPSCDSCQKFPISGA